MRRLHPFQRAYRLGFRRAQVRARKQFRAELDAELALLRDDLADIAKEHRQHLDVELAILERVADPDALLH
jgi:hypothetical protein